MAPAAKKKIQMRAKARELHQQAEAKLDELKEDILGSDEGETQLSNEEIQERKQEVKNLRARAKEIEDLGDLEGMAKRSDDASEEAKNMLREVISDAAEEARERKDRDGPTSEFKGAMEFLRAVRTANGEFAHRVDVSEKQRAEMRLLSRAADAFERGEAMKVTELGDTELKTLVGDDSGSDGRGDHLVPTEHLAELLRAMAEEQQFVPRARRVPMSRRQVDFPRLEQTDANDTRPMFSFAAVTKKGEGAQIDEREATFEQLTLTAHKYAAYTEASDELLSDSIIDLQPLIISLLTNAIAYEYDRDAIQGSGSSEPQGFIGSNAEFAQNRQTSNQVDVDDVFNLESHFFGDDGFYMYHPTVIPDLYGLQSNNIIVWNGDLSSETPGVLLGRQLVRSAKMPSLGSKGDLSLVDPSMYLAGDLQRITVANSVDFKFRNAVTAWRAQFRGAGTPWPAGTFSHESDGSNKTHEISPFVVLDSAVAS